MGHTEELSPSDQRGVPCHLLPCSGIKAAGRGFGGRKLLPRDWLGISLFVAGWVAAFAPLDFFLSSFLHLLNSFISPHSFSCLCSPCSLPCPAGWELWCLAGLSQGIPGLLMLLPAAGPAAEADQRDPAALQAGPVHLRRGREAAFQPPGCHQALHGSPRQQGPGGSPESHLPLPQVISGPLKGWGGTR